MRFILGSGIVGMVTSFYFKDFMILTKGKGQDGMKIGPKILKKTQYTESFIKKINYKLKSQNLNFLKSREFRCAYNIGGNLSLQITDEEVKQYIAKTRGGETNIEKFKSNALNDGMTSMEGYPMDEVYRALSSTREFKTRRLFLDVNKINTKKHVIEGNNPAISNIRLSFNYEHLLNTLPAHLFNSLVTGEKCRSHGSEIIIYIIRSEEIFKSLGNCDFVYYPDKDVPYYRITKIGRNILSIETKKLFFPNAVLKAKHKLLNTLKLPFGKISDSVQPKEGINLKHIGRYANNNNSLRVHNIIEIFEKGEFEL